MIARCIVSVFTRLKKTAVLFDSKMRSSFEKSLLVLSAFSMPLLSNAQLTSNDWWGTSNHVIKSANDCNTVYRISYTTQAYGQIEFKKNGNFVNSHNTVLASDVPSTIDWHQKGGPDAPDAIHCTESQDVVLYFISGTEKDTISTTMPTYAQIGATGVGYEEMNLTSTPTFTAAYCGAGSPSASATYQWQVYNKKTEVWSDVDGATSTEFSPAAGSLPDSCSVRVVFTDGSTVLESNSLIAYYGSPNIAYKIDGTEIFKTVQKPSYENEIDFGESFTVSVEATGAGEFTEYILQARSDNDGTFADLMTVSAPNNSFTVEPSANLEYRVVAKGNDLRPGREGDEVTVMETFFVRVRFSWDEGAKVDTLFYDNFGKFTSENTYVTYSGTTFTDSLTDEAGVTNAVKKHWAPDYYNSVKNHQYSDLNPLVGPFNGDCGADGYKHYNCWEDGACDGYRVEDGYYAILPNPNYSNCGRSTKDYWDGPDHTSASSNEQGGMLFVNCNEGSAHTVLLERQINLSNTCENTRLLFSAYVNNATSVSDNKPVNVRLIIRDQDSTIVYETPSGNIYPRTNGGLWANLSFMFSAAKGGKYTLQLVNNQEGGALDAGNDLLFDDILILAAYPTVNVYRDRLKTNASPIDTCAEVEIPLFVLNRQDIKKYITDPIYLYQYSKDTVNWVNIGNVTSLDSFVINLTKSDSKYWDTTYFRGIVASTQEVIDHILAGNPPVLSCDSVYAVSSPYRVVFDYSGPLDADIKDTVCVGETFTAKVSAHKRPAYRFVDSYTKETIKDMDTTFSYTVKATDPADTLFYFVTEQRLGCTDTMKIQVHRRLIVDFNTPDNFTVCLYDSLAKLTNVVPSNATFTWTSGDYSENTTVPAFKIPATLPQKGTVTVKGSAKDYCDATKSFSYDIHNPIKVSLEAERNDSLFCLADPTSTFKLTAKTEEGAPVTYYWTMDGTQVASTTAPTNTYSFGSLTQGKHLFGVKVADEVCNVTGSSEFNIDLPTEVREPITIQLTADESVCENATANATVKLNNLLNAEGTTVTWTVSSANASLAATTLTDAQQTSANVVKPSAVTNTTEQILISASVVDKVCTTNNPKADASIDMYKVIDAVVTTDRADSLFCMSGSTGITFNVEVKRGFVKNYYWYSDGIFFESTGHDAPTYTFPVTTEGQHTYGVQMTDGVCNVRDNNEFKFEVPIETRLPITIELTADEKICEDVNANAQVKFEHLLDADATQVYWTVGANAQLANEYTTTAASASSNVVLPVPTTNTTEQITLAASVVDKVCTDNVPTANAVINMYKKLNVAIKTDREDGLFCMDGSTGITFTATTIRGEVSNYTWFADSVQVGTTGPDGSSYTFPVVTEGKHVYGVKMSDGVCNPVGGGELSFDVPVETRMPITMQLVAGNSFCEDKMLDIEAHLSHLLTEPTQVIWSATENGKIFDATATENGISKNVLVPNSLTNAKEQIVISAAVNDLVCPENNPVKVTDTIELHKMVAISLAADGLSGQKCLATSTDKSNGLTVTVDRGNPAYYIWSDGVRTSEPTRDYELKLGENLITVEAYDSVCVSDGAAATANVGVITREPLKVSLSQTKGTNPICIGNDVEFTATVENNFPGDEFMYAWNPSYGVSNSIKFTPTSGYNTVSVSVIADNAICPAGTDETSLYVQDSLVISILAPEFLCQSIDTTAEVELLVKIWAGDPSAFVWSTGDTTLVGKAYDKPTADMVYWVYAIDEVCANSFKVYSDTVEVSNMFTIDIDVAEEEVQMGTNAELTGIIPQNVTPAELSWTMIDDEILAEYAAGTSMPGNHEVFMPEKGTYSFFAVADGKHCGYIYSDTVTVDVADYYQIPTAFTPYNDNPKNNVFMKGYSVEIFNRYQQMVYEGADGWDGQYNGKLADPGTYFYRLRKKDGRVIKGTIELVKF